VLSKWLFRILPRESQLLYRFAERYVSRYRSENDANMYTNGEFRFLAEVLPRSRVVFDVGANTGDWSRHALDVNSAIELHCFEPSPATYRLLIARRFPANVVCNNFGLGSVAGEARLLVFDDGSGLNSLYRRQGLEAGWGLRGQSREETVHIDTLDNYLDRIGLATRIDLCKVDVEGHELEVLRGMSAAMRRRQVAMIQFEYGGCNVNSRTLLKDLFELLHAFDYELHKLYPDGLRLVPQYDQRLENFQYQNWIAVLKDRSPGD